MNNTTALDPAGNGTAAFLDCPDPSLCFPTTNADHVPLAFGLTTAAGLATIVGAIPPLIPCIKHTNRKLLAGSLASAAGVMIYVSFVEIFVKADSYFCCLTEDHHVLTTIFCFFGGILLTVGINGVVHAMEMLDRRYDFRALIVQAVRGRRRFGRKASNDYKFENGLVTQTSVESGDPGIPDVPQFQEVKENSKELITEDSKSISESAVSGSQNNIEKNGSDSPELQSSDKDLDAEETNTAQELADTKDFRQLRRMGILSCLAIGIHNVPEGLATFVATTADPTFGAALALAIGLHNIPEGLTVAMPIFYATKSRWKAFLFAAISAIAEPIGGFIGWLTLRNAFGPLAYALSFGLVAGMMVYISMVELLRLAFKFDSKGYISTMFVILGMFLMAVSLLLFEY